MSLLWRKKPLRIGLGPNKLIVSEGKPVVLQLVDSDAEWRAAVDALPSILSSRKSREASVVLADQLVRYALLPWSASLKRDEQWLALARHRFGAVHGARAAEWEVTLTETAPAGARLACAIDRDLLKALATTFAAAGVRLISAQPFLAVAYNRVRETIGSGSCWLLVEEPGRLTLALIQRGAWTAIRTRRVDERWRRVLPEILAREAAFLGLDAPCTRVIVCAQSAFDTEGYESFRLQALSYPELALA
ncbi:MAG TPA: hypothetical protein VML57_14365 [Burkholderiales bacterium]|nr:hypothetical protein [Burkholderiales bacterium]